MTPNFEARSLNVFVFFLCVSFLAGMFSACDPQNNAEDAIDALKMANDGDLKKIRREYRLDQLADFAEMLEWFQATGTPLLDKTVRELMARKDFSAVMVQFLVKDWKNDRALPELMRHVVGFERYEIDIKSLITFRTMYRKEFSDIQLSASFIHRWMHSSIRFSKEFFYGLRTGALSSAMLSVLQTEWLLKRNTLGAQETEPITTGRMRVRKYKWYTQCRPVSADLGVALAKAFPKVKVYRVRVDAKYSLGGGWTYHYFLLVEVQKDRWVAIDPILLRVSHVNDLGALSPQEWFDQMNARSGSAWFYFSSIDLIGP